HAAGDAVLREFALRLREGVRVTDLVARLGGDEFVILLEDVDAAAIAEMIAAKIIAAMKSGITVEGSLLPIGTSIRIAHCSNVHANADELMQMADAALYEGKAAGRNTFRVAR